MPKVTIYDMTGKSVGEKDLSDAIFGIVPNKVVLHAVIKNYLANRRLEGITQSTLTRQLRELEEDGFLHREVFGEVPPRVEYTLTPLGESFAPLLHTMLEWSRDNLTQEDGHGNP